MFTKLKAALVRALGLGETEAHTLVTAVEADLVPMLAEFKAQLVAEVKAAVAEGKVDAEKLAGDIAAKLGSAGATATTAAAN